MRNSFIFYASFYEALEPMEPEQFKRVFVAIIDYALFNKTTELTGIDKSIFSLIKPQIDANNRKYENGKKGAEYGELGGRPPDNSKNPRETPSEPQGNPRETPNVNVDVNDNVNVDVADQPTTGIKKSIQENAKGHGFIISEMQVASFIINITDESWLTGKFNFIDFVIERIKNSGKPYDEQVRMFVKSWDQDFYLQEFPAWRDEQLLKANNKATQAAIKSAYDNPPLTCKCGGELKSNGVRLLCFGCRSAMEFRDGAWVEEKDST
jgi:hypothetical protein